jgi:hypothetical protein
MLNLYSSICDSWILCICLLFSIIVILILACKKNEVQVIQNNNKEPEPDKPEPSKFIVVIKFIFNITVKYGIPATILGVLLNYFGIIDSLIDSFSSSPKQTQTTIVYIYDTDPSYNQLIKGSLSEEQFPIFDNLLEKEKSQCGEKLPDTDIQWYSNKDQMIIEAYERWRKCKDLMRSRNHTVYPSERHLLE